MSLNESAFARCQPCTEEQKNSCTEVNISYENQNGPNSPDWVADMWYAPCKVNPQSAGPFYAHDWDKNRCCVQTGTTVQIGRMGTSDSSVDQMVNGREFNVLCRGETGQSNDPPCCRNADIPLSCTNVTVTFDPDLLWYPGLKYTPCENKCASYAEITVPETFKITPGSLVEIRGVGRKILISEKLSGLEVNVRCSGSFASMKCCVVGSPNCHPKQTNELPKGKKKAPQKAPSGTKASEKTLGKEKQN